MELSPSAHLDTFCRDRLPPREQWPEFRFDLPELNYPERLNCAAELLDATAAKVGYGRPCLHSLTETWDYGKTVRLTNQLAQVLTEDFGLQPGNRVLLRGPNSPWLAAAWLAVGISNSTEPVMLSSAGSLICELAMRAPDFGSRSSASSLLYVAATSFDATPIVCCSRAGTFAAACRTHTAKTANRDGAHAQAALGQHTDHDIQRNIVTAHNDKIGRALGFPDQRDFHLAVGIERGGERIDGKKSVGLRERRHRA